MEYKVTRKRVALAVIGGAFYELIVRFCLDVMIQVSPEDAAMTAGKWILFFKKWAHVWVPITAIIVGLVYLFWPWIESKLAPVDVSPKHPPLDEILKKLIPEVNKPNLRMTIGQPDLHHAQRTFYLQAKVSNDGSDTVRGVKAKLINFPDFGTTVPKDFDLPWSNTRPGAIDLKGGEKDVFDIGVMPSTGYPPLLEMLVYLGSKRITQKYRYPGTYPMEIQLLADGMEPITKNFEVTIASGEHGNTLTVLNKDGVPEGSRKLDPVKAFQDWIVFKSKELLALKTEIELWRWKESMLKGIAAAIKPEYKWNEEYEGSYSYGESGIVIPFSHMLITMHERWLEGMRRSVTDEHFCKDFNPDNLER